MKDCPVRTSDVDDLKKGNGFTLEKERSRQYPAWTITDADYTDDIALLANTPAQTESLLHSLERTAGGIGLHVNADKTEYMCNQRVNISTLSWVSQKLVEKFTYFGSSVSFTENDINTRLAKAWTYIDMTSGHILMTSGHMEVRPIWWNKTLRSCPYFCVDAPHGRWLSV